MNTDLFIGWYMNNRQETLTNKMFKKAVHVMCCALLTLLVNQASI